MWEIMKVTPLHCHQQQIGVKWNRRFIIKSYME